MKVSNEMSNYGTDDLSGRQKANAYIQDICSEYGLYGRVIYYASPTVPESDRNRTYIIAGTDPAILEKDLPDYIKPEELVRRAARSEKFFYPKVWVHDLSADSDQMKATEALVDYCKKAEFLRHLYSEYLVPLPEVIRTSEVAQLVDACDAMNHPNATQELRAKVRKDLDAFFKTERSSRKKDWMAYFRSDRFPDGKGRIAKIQGFKNRAEQEVDLDQLKEFNGDICNLEMQEHEYKIFRELMRKLHPDVTYSVGKKTVIDHGLDPVPDAENSPFGHSVSGEEYAVIRKERFADEGWSALMDLKMAYWELRNIYFRDVDEPLVASVYNKIALEYAKCDSIADLMEHGPMHLKRITATDFMNFVSLAKANGLRFYIDTDGIYAIPSLKYVNVIYNEDQTELLASITARMMDDKVNDSHLVSRMPLDARITENQLSQQKKAMKHLPGYTRD